MYIHITNQSYESRCGVSVGTDKKLFKTGGARFLYGLNTKTTLLNMSFSLSGSSPKYRSFVSAVKKRIRYHHLQLFCEEN